MSKLARAVFFDRSGKFSSGAALGWAIQAVCLGIIVWLVVVQFND